MGVDHNVYAGPFALCQNEQQEKVGTKLSCTNSGCSNYGKTLHDKFCPNCGFPVGDFDITYTTERVDSYDLADVMCLMCCVGGLYGDVWVSNDISDDFYDFGHEHFVKCLMGEEVSKAIDDFKKKHISDLEMLKEAYGEDNVKIKWGVVGWMS